MNRRSFLGGAAALPVAGLAAVLAARPTSQGGFLVPQELAAALNSITGKLTQSFTVNCFTTSKSIQAGQSLKLVDLDGNERYMRVTRTELADAIQTIFAEDA